MSRIKRQYCTTRPEVYERFIERTKPSLEVNSLLWRKIVYMINQAYRDYILETGEKVRMPFGFGDLSINKKLRKHTTKYPDGNDRICLPIDWVKTRKAGKHIYNFNEHSDGYFYGWIYFRPSGRMKFNKLWDFSASRDSSRLLAKYIKAPNTDYKYLYREYHSYR